MTDSESTFTIDFDADFPSRELLEDESHTLGVKVEGPLSDVYLEFSSRLAMREFAKTLLFASINGGTGLFEYNPFTLAKQLPVVEGVRLTRESLRLFVFYPNFAEEEEAQAKNV